MHGVGHVLEGREAVLHVLGHERQDAVRAGTLDVWGDVDQHERVAARIIGRRTQRAERCGAAERCTDQHGMIGSLVIAAMSAANAGIE